MRRMQTRAERQCYQGLNEPGKSSESVLYAFCFLSSCSDAGYRKQVAVHLGHNGEMMVERQMSVETEGATTPAPFPCRIAPQFNQVAGANGGLVLVGKVSLGPAVAQLTVVFAELNKVLRSTSVNNCGCPILVVRQSGVESRSIFCHSSPMSERISINPKVCHGQACITGTRIPVHQIVRMFAHGDSIDGLLGAYPSISREDILACLDYAASLAEEQVTPLDDVTMAR